MLNEQLYTERGCDALRRYRDDPSVFAAYHAAYQDQVREWPFNPLDRIRDELLALLRERRAEKNAAAPLVIADMGCGEAHLARDLLAARIAPAGALSVRSFDLVADKARGIEACDLARLPLADDSVDVVVLCLALMGTDWPLFLREARRVLKKDGVLKLAEVGSRFQNRDGFVHALRVAGFQVREVRDAADDAHFFRRFNCVLLDDSKPPTAAVAGFKAAMLKPCLYKRR
jgi:ribosomal RNA-processing protein 8